VAVALFVGAPAFAPYGGVAAAQAPAGTIRGQVRTEDGAGMAGVTLTFSAGVKPAGTDAAGAFASEPVETGDYVVTPAKEGYVFEPSERTVTVTPDEDAQADFVAVPAKEAQPAKEANSAGPAAMAVAKAVVPLPPTGVSATDGSYADKVRVVWKTSSGATAYEVWRNTTSSASSAARVGSPTSTSYDDTSATPGKTYYSWIKAKNSAGTSGFSGCDTGYRPTPPAVPTGVSATDGSYSSSVRVTWSASAGANGYQVFRGVTTNSGSAVGLVSTTRTYYDDSAASPGIVYYYWVKAVNAAGMSGFSNCDAGHFVKQVAFTRSTHPSLRSPLSAQSLFDTGAAALFRDDDGNGNCDVNDDVSLAVRFTIRTAGSATFPNQSASTFPVSERYDYTLPKYNDIPNDAVCLQLLAGKFAQLKQVNTGNNFTGVTSRSYKSLILTQSARATTSVHEWGHLCGLSDLYDAAYKLRIMYGYASDTKCEINTSERNAMSAY
jgi:hypothetical protein